MYSIKPQSSCPSDSLLRVRLPADLAQSLQAIFGTRRSHYIACVLTPGELRILGNVRDALIIARIKRMPARKLQQFDQWIPVDAAQQKFYQAVQFEWLRREQYLLGMRLRRAPTDRDLIQDFMNNHNGERFRAFFAMKYPGRMRLRSKTSAKRPRPITSPRASGQNLCIA